MRTHVQGVVRVARLPVNAAKGDRAVQSSNFCISAINAGEKIPAAKNKRYRVQVARDINFSESFSCTYGKKEKLGCFKAAVIILVV